MSGQSGRHRIQLSLLNDQLTCKLCGGYYIDATTIIECLHSFCRSCIVKYLKDNKYCPICEVQVHKSRPLQNIRPDHTLQDIVYKLVPACYQNEMRCRKEFYLKHPEACSEATTPEARGEPTESHIYSPEENLNLSLEYYSPSKDVKEIAVKPLLKRYLRCPAAVTIFHLQKLIRAKYGLMDTHRVDILYKEELLCSSYSLMDVMYIYHWRRKVPLHLSYRIFESSAKRIKLSEDNINFKMSLLHAGIHPIESKEEKSVKKEWKEVQLKISETGIMSITNITDQQCKKTIKVEESIETMSTSILKENSRNNLSEDIKENEQCSNKQNTNDSKVSSKLKECNDQRSSNQTEMVKTSIEEIENLMNSKHDDESKIQPNNNNDENKTTLQKVNQSQEITHCGNENEMQNNNIENKDQKELSKNNNNIVAENKLDFKQNTRSEMKLATTGSKINALSVKLQFQPKPAQISSNSPLKKTGKDRKMILQSSKKSDVKIAESPKAVESKNSIDSSKMEVVTNNCSGIVKPFVSCSTKSISQKSESQNSVESTQSTCPSTSINSVSGETQSNIKNAEPIAQDGHSVKMEITVEEKSHVSDETCKKPVERTNGQTNSLVQKSSYSKIDTLTNDNVSSLSFPTSLSVSVGNGINSASTSILNQSASTFPSTVHTVPDLVNSTILKNSLKSLPASPIQKLSTTTTSENEVPTSSKSENSVAFTIPSVSPSKNTSLNYTSITSTKESTSKVNMEITNTYSVPPCPDAIPISLMKPAVRKTESITKGSNLNEICAKIGASGSKINDICAKIGENSKEKSKTEARSKSDIPDLVKIGSKNGSSSIAIDSINKQQHTNIPSVPIYAQSSSSSISTESKNIYSNIKDSLRATSLVTTSPITTPHTLALQKVPSFSKKQNQPMGYKTLRDPPKCWNPALSKNDYVALKNQNKEAQNQSHQTIVFEKNKTIQSKPAKIFKMKNTPRYLGNPVSGVKPMYGIGNECKEKEQMTMTSTTTTNTSSSSKNGNLSMMKIDPKTLSPIMSTVNSPIVSPPPYSPSARNYPYTRDICRSTGSPISPKNSPVNMLSTSPFIPSPTPNMNPRLIYSHYPPFPDARFSNPLIRSPIGISSPSAFHSSLPPAINKLYRSSYIPQTTGFSPVSQPPTVQRIPPSTYSSPKSSKTTSQTVNSPTSYSLGKPDTQTIPTSSHETKNLLLPETKSQEDVSAFNLSKTGSFSNAETVKVSTEIKNSQSTPLSPIQTSNNGQTKNTVSKTKSEVSQLSTADGGQDQSKEQLEKESTKSKEQNSSSPTKGQKEKRRSDENKESLKESTEKSVPQINGDVSSESKEEPVTGKIMEQTVQSKDEQNEKKITQTSGNVTKKDEKEESKKEECEKAEKQKHNSETLSKAET